MKTLFSTPYASLIEKDGWTFASRTKGQGAVGLIAITPNNEVVLVEQFRVPHGKNTIELPAGLVADNSPNEDALSAAKKELLEETGYEAGKIEAFGAPVCSSAGLTDESIQLFIATDLKKTGTGGGVHTENIQVHLVPLRGYMSWVLDQQTQGKITDSKLFAVPGILLYTEGVIAP